MSRSALRLGFALVATLLVAACGGKEQATATPAARTASSPAVTAAAATSRPGAAGPGVSAVGLGFCGGWPAVAAQNSRVTAAAPGASADLKTNLESSAAAMKSMADQAPAEIRADFQLYAKFWSEYAAVMAKANYDFMKMATDPELQKTMESMADPKLEQAGKNIEAWAQKNCAGVR